MAKMDAIERMQLNKVTNLQLQPWRPPQIWNNLYNAIFKYDNIEGMVRFNIKTTSEYHKYIFQFRVSDNFTLGDLEALVAFI